MIDTSVFCMAAVSKLNIKMEAKSAVLYRLFQGATLTTFFTVLVYAQ